MTVFSHLYYPGLMSVFFSLDFQWNFVSADVSFYLLTWDESFIKGALLLVNELIINYSLCCIFEVFLLPVGIPSVVFSSYVTLRPLVVPCAHHTAPVALSFSSSTDATKVVLLAICIKMLTCQPTTADIIRTPRLQLWIRAPPKYKEWTQRHQTLNCTKNIFYSIKEEGREGENNHNCTGRNWLLNTMCHSIKKLTFSSLIFTHLFCTNTKKRKLLIIVLL